MEEEELRKAEEYFREKIKQRMSQGTEITGGPSKHIKKIIEERDVERVMSEVFVIIYKDGPLYIGQLMEILIKKEIETRNHLGKALEKLEEQELIRKIQERDIESFSITIKGKEFIEEEINKAEETRKSIERDLSQQTLNH